MTAVSSLASQQLPQLLSPPSPPISPRGQHRPQLESKIKAEFLDRECVGFGEKSQNGTVHDDPVSKIQYVALIALVALIMVGTAGGGGLLVGGVVAAFTFSAKALVIGAVIGGGIGFIGTAVLSIIVALKQYKTELTLAPWNSQNGPLKNVGKATQADMVVSKDAAETHAWKLELIRNAKHSVEISGSFCGGEAFIESMNAVEHALSNNENLKVRFMISDELFESNDHARIALLKKKFPDADVQFLFTNIKFKYYPDQDRVTPGLISVQNHVKFLGVDEEEVIIGGTNLHPNLSTVGLETRPLPQGATLNQKMLHAFWTGAARDQDVLYKSKEMGKTMRWQFYQLWQVWAHQMGDEAALKVTGYEPIKTSSAQKQSAQDPSVQVQASQAQSSSKSLWETLPKERVAKNTSVTPLVSHPNAHNSITEATAKIINDGSAQKTAIKIAGMSFCPAPVVMDALLKAVDEGREITILTNGTPEGCPFGNQLFAPAYAQFALKLLAAQEKRLSDPTKSHLKGRIKFYNWIIPNVIYHKKNVWTPDMALVGNSNLNCKSDGVFLKNGKKVGGDFECGVIFDSKTAIKALDESFDIDLKPEYSREVTMEEIKLMAASWHSHFLNNYASSFT